MDICKNQPCFKCFYFEQFKYLDDYCCTYSPAQCNHPDCFEEKRTQDDFGMIFKKRKRVKNIINLVNEQSECSRFNAFRLVAQKTFLWFKKYVKIAVEEESK